jgi:HEAT repeat protein
MKNLLEYLLEDCRSNDPSRQTQAIMTLHEQRLYESVPTLLDLLNSPEEGIRCLVVEALGDLGKDEIDKVGPALHKMLSDSEYLVRSYTIEALTTLNYEPVIESAKFFCRHDPESLVRISAIEALALLANIADNSVLALMCEIFEDPNEDELVASYAAWAIGVLGTPEFLPILKEYLDSEESLHIKADLLASRYRLGAHEELDPLLDLLTNADNFFSGIILNLIEGLTKLPDTSYLVTNASRICTIIEKVGESFSIERNHADQVIAVIKKIRSS